MKEDEVVLSINDIYSGKNFLDDVRRCLQGKHANSFPFPHFSLPKFANVLPNYLDRLRNELRRIGWSHKSTDLYDVHQTPDLGTLPAADWPAVGALRAFLRGTVCDWLQVATGINLATDVSINGSKYGHTNGLLPHDDRLEGRAFAFIYYLPTVEWQVEFGGRLQLYTTADPDLEPQSDLNYNRNSPGTGQSGPTVIAKSIVPAENTFFFFRVQSNSWHAVEEVVAPGIERLSINGWFYYADKGDEAGTAASSRRRITDLAIRQSPLDAFSVEEQLYWLNPSYLSPINVLKIQTTFTEQMEISLANLLKPQHYSAICDEIRALDADFRPVGTLERRHFHWLTDAESRLVDASQLGRFLRFLRSESFLVVLSQWTSLPLSRYVETDDEEESGAGGNTDEPPVAKKSRPATYSGGQPSASAAGCSRSKENADCKDSKNGAETSVPAAEMKWSLSRFSRGCYTVLDDASIADAESDGHSVDILLYFLDDTWPTDCGGFTSYYAKDESEETLRVSPTANTLSIVFRPPNVSSFTKYLNCLTGERKFYVFRASIYHRIDDGNDDDDDQSEDVNESVDDKSAD